jgi:putative ABC transport system ATP-binding protein
MSDGAPAIELDDLRFSWQPGAPLLELPQLTIARGERLFLHGPSGSGKSTLLGLVGGVLVPVTGAVRLLGTDLGSLGAAGRDAFRADHVGFVFQLFNLLPYLSVLDNVLLPARFSRLRAQRAGDDPRAEARRLLGELGLGDAALLARPASELSVGQQQRVAVARALLGRPEILVADEPTSALDADARDAFIDLLVKECAQSSTSVLFVSHDVRLAPLFDRSVSLAALNRAHPHPETA